MNIIAVLQRYWPGLRGPVLRSLVLSAVTALVLVFVPNHYTSEAQILPKDLNSGGLLNNLMATAAALGVNVGGAQGDDSASYVDILNSRKVADTVLGEKYEFGMRPLFFLAPRRKSMSLYDYLDEDNRDLAVEKFQKRLMSVDRDLKSGLITVRVTTNSADLSKQALDVAVNELESFIQASTQRNGKANAEFSQGRLDEAIAAATASEVKLEQFASDHRNYALSPDPEVRITGLRLEADLALRRQVVATLTLTLQQAMLDAKNDTPVLNILDRPSLPIQKSSPSRGIWTIFAFVLGLLGSLAWRERGGIRAFLLERPAR